MAESSLNFLRSIGIQEWVLSGDENFVSFSEWFSSSITDSNIATDTVILEYRDLQSCGIELIGDALRDAYAEIKSEYQNIWSLEKFDVQRMQYRRHDARTADENHVDAVHHLKICQTAIVDDLAATTKLLDEFVDAVAKCTERCVRKVHDLQETKQRNRKSINELVHRYIKPQKFPLFVHQMSLEQYFKKCDTFLNSADTYFDKNFAVELDPDSQANSSTAAENYAGIVEELKEIKTRLYAAKYTLCNQSSEIYAQRELIESFKTHNWMPMNNSALRKEIHDMEIRNSNVLELRMENLLNELEDQFEQIIDKHIEAVIYESNKDKILRAKKRHQYLDNIANVISDGLMNAECLWILMQIDLGRVKKRQSIDELIENYTMEAKLSRKRFDTLQKKMSSDKEANVYNAFMVKWRQLMPFAQRPEDIETPESCIPLAVGLLDKTDLRITECFNEICSGGNIQNSLSCLANMKSKEAELLSYTNDGPVDKPIFWNMMFVQEKNTLQNELKHSSLLLAHLKQELQHFQQQQNTEKLQRHQRQLWIWFLKEPKNVLRAIKTVTDEARNLSKNVIAKPLSGISRKN